MKRRAAIVTGWVCACGTALAAQDMPQIAPEQADERFLQIVPDPPERLLATMNPETGPPDVNIESIDESVTIIVDADLPEDLGRYGRWRATPVNIQQATYCETMAFGCFLDLREIAPLGVSRREGMNSVIEAVGNFPALLRCLNTAREPEDCRYQ